MTESEREPESEPEAEVPRLPRGRGLKLSGPELVKIGMLAAALIALIVLQRPCSDSVAKLVTSFDGSGSAAIPKPGTVDRGSDGSAGASGTGNTNGAGDANGTGNANGAGNANGTDNANGAGNANDIGSGYTRLTPDMTPEQVRAAIEKARAEARGSN